MWEVLLEQRQKMTARHRLTDPIACNNVYNCSIQHWVVLKPCAQTATWVFFLIVTDVHVTLNGNGNRDNFETKKQRPCHKKVCFAATLDK